MDHVIYQLTLGKCNWDLRTWIWVSNKENIKSLEDRIIINRFEKLSSVVRSHHSEELYKNYNYYHFTPDGLLYHDIEWWVFLAIKVGRNDIVKNFYHNCNIDKLIPAAASMGNMEIVLFLLNKGATNYNKCLEYAAMEGHREIMLLMLEKGATNITETILWAVEHGFCDVVEIMINKDNRYMEDCLVEAVCYDHYDVVKILLKNKKFSDENLSHSLEIAERGENVKIFKLLRRYGAQI